MAEFSFEPPVDNVICIVDDKAEYEALLSALHAAGYTETSHLFGKDGYEKLDPEGTEHGFLARASRAFQRFTTGVDERVLDRMGEALKARQYVVAAQTDGSDEQKEEVRQVMSNNGGTGIFYSAQYSIELMEGW